MTPKEKAQELIDKYSIWAWNETVCDHNVAKQCALIAVDEILENERINYGIEGFVFNYWQEVKSELEKL